MVKVYFILGLIFGSIFLNGCKSLATYNSIPENYRVLFWSQDKREKAFTQMQKHSDVAIISASPNISALPLGEELDIDGNIDDYIETQNLAGIIVLHKGQIRLEKYARGLTPHKNWSSFSIAKSITSTLVGAAVKDGYIKSVHDNITTYIPELKGSAYDAVTVRHLLTMTSGVKWDENYGDIKSDVAQFIAHEAEDGMDVTLSYMRGLERENLPGTRFNYSTGETNLAGILVSKATGTPLAQYLSDKIWKPYGMEADALWALSPTGEEIGGCCISARLRDYARFGQFILDGAVINGVSIVPDDWMETATTSQHIYAKGRGYGYLWWTYPNQSFTAKGIFGQQIGIVPTHDYLIVTLSNWPSADGNSKILRNRLELFGEIGNALFPEITE